MRFGPCLLAVSVTVLLFSTACSPAQDSPLFGPGGFAFSGKWKCDGSFPANGKKYEHHALYEGRIVSGGKWIELTQKDTLPSTYDATMLIGYDTNKKEVVNYVADNQGWGVLTGPGWQGHSLTLTMTGEASYPGFSAEKPLPVSRVTYQVKSADAFSLQWEVRQGSEWRPDDTLDCVRPESAGSKAGNDGSPSPQAG